MGKDHALTSEEVLKGGENQDRVSSEKGNDDSACVIWQGWENKWNIHVFNGKTFAEYGGSPGRIQQKTTNISNFGTRKGMTLPFQPLSLTFHNVCYYVDMPPVSSKY